MVDDVVQVMCAHDLPVHEIEYTSESECVTLGWNICGAAGIIRPTSRRCWRIIFRVQFLLRIHSVTGKQLQLFLGHMIFI